MFLRVRDESGDGNPKPSMSERKKGQRFPFQSSKDDFHLHITLHQEKIKPRKLGGWWRNPFKQFMNPAWRKFHLCRLSQRASWVSYLTTDPVNIKRGGNPRLWIPSPKSLYHLSYLYKQYTIYDIYNIQLPSSPIERQMSSLWKVSLNLGRMRTKMLAKFPVRYKFSLGYQTIFTVLYWIKP